MFVEEKTQGEVTEARTPKLSEVIRECGYGNGMDYDDCVIGRAYKRLTGSSLARLGEVPIPKEARVASSPVARVSSLFGVPYNTVLDAEQMCYGKRRSKEQIADWLEAQGY